MLILFKQSIKTILLLVLFITGATYLHAGNTHMHGMEIENNTNPVNIIQLNNYSISNFVKCSSQDTNINVQNEPATVQLGQDEKFSIPKELENQHIQFRINSEISYLNFNHFVGNEPRKVFFHAWLKEKEVEKLSVLTDSLRKAYSNASPEQKEAISGQIINAENQSIALNEEIPGMYQKAWEEENRYWQTASQVAILRFQEKISLFNDSLAKISGAQNIQGASTPSEISDTITLYKPDAKPTETKTEVAANIIYKVQIGAYKGKIPESANKLIKKISVIRKVENHVDEKGMKVFTTGNLRFYPEAVTMLSQVKQEGIKNAVIIAYMNGKKTTVTEARKLNKEL